MRRFEGVSIDNTKSDQTAGSDLPILRGGDRLVVGKFSTSGLFVGDLDEVNVLNYTMTGQQVQDLWLRRGQP